MSLSKSKCWYSNNCLHFLKRSVPLQWSPAWGSTLDGSSLTCKYQVRVEVNGCGKHCSLLSYGNNYVSAKFYSTGPLCTGYAGIDTNKEQTSNYYLSS